MMRITEVRRPIAGPKTRRSLLAAAGWASLLVHLGAAVSWAADQPAGDRGRRAPPAPCQILADGRLGEPLGAIAEEFRRRARSPVTLTLRPAVEVNRLVEKRKRQYHVVLSMAPDGDGNTAISALAGSRKVAWKHPTGEPVWAAVLSNHPQAAPFLRFVGGPTGHRLWSESEAGFTIVSGENRAEAYEWVVKHRVGHTYPLTAMRMLRECGGIRKGICIDIGCGSGPLEVELAKRSELTIIGLDIDPDVQPLFEKRIAQAGLQDRVSFVVGDAQQLPFPDDYADLIVSRGTLTFIPDIGKCLREVDRVLKPTGVAFLGGRYLYTPQVHKMSTETLRKIVDEAGVPGARVIDSRGQWVKIVGPQAPEAAQRFQGGPDMLPARILADYRITQGKCLLICRSDGAAEQALQRGLVAMTDLEITALYPSDELAEQAETRIRQANLADRITCKTGDVQALPFEEGSFDLAAGVGPILLWGDRETAMRELYRVLREGGAALIGGKFLHMPDWRKVSSETLRASAANTGIPSIRVYDDMGQWVEILKGVRGRDEPE